MINIITAIGNPKLNNELKKQNEFNIICNDIQYKEGILEILESNQTVDFVIISYILAGQISTEELTEEISKINKKIKIIIILEEKNKTIENKLISKGIFDFFYNEIDINYLINILKNNNIEIINKELRKEIDNLKELINKKNEENNKGIFNKINIKNNKKIKEKINKKNNIIKDKEDCKVLGICGNNGVGKSSFLYFLANYLSKNYKILLLDLNLKNNDLNIFYNLKKEFVEEEIFNIKNYIKIINKNLFIISNFNELIFDKKIDLNYLINKINLIKNNYDFILIDTNSDTEIIENKIIFDFCDTLILLSYINNIEIKKTEILLKNINKKYQINNEKINIILYKINKINYLFNKKIIEKSSLIKYKNIGKICNLFFYNLYLKNEKILNKKIFFKRNIFKIINKIFNQF